MKIRYNGPVSLTFSALSVLILCVDQRLFPGIVVTVFTVPGRGVFDFRDVDNYFRIFAYVLGHRDWVHLGNNLMFVLLLGPVLEERVGSGNFFFMILATVFLGGVVNSLFFPTPLVGSSGVAFMMIVLTSFANVGKTEVPISFFFVMALYLWREFMDILVSKDVSHVSHIIGGVCGGIFGFAGVMTTDDKKTVSH